MRKIYFVLLCIGVAFTAVASRARGDDVVDTLDELALSNLEIELKASCTSQRPGEARMYISYQTMDRSLKLTEVLKKRFDQIQRYLRNPYERYDNPALRKAHEVKTVLEVEVEKLERLQGERASRVAIDSQRARVISLKHEMDRYLMEDQAGRYYSKEKMNHAEAELARLGKWADRLGLVQKKAESCYGFANAFKTETAKSAGAGN